MNLYDLLPAFLRRTPKPSQRTVVLRHFGIPDAEHDARLRLESMSGQSRFLTKRARDTYAAIYRSLSDEERRAAERAVQ